ncbi:hypothetical protein HMPREF0970_01644 [Schaalia odontolytica F0309]|uniref:Uncharacterized protein n=1 Tax=Schaalia odontolytica F0309 TaxID=649742 RepID=D4U0A5_9ACTO|nr:hypothetical protein HMPREF0970_01644 [Schaalia odontolytica F0309]
MASADGFMNTQSVYGTKLHRDERKELCCDLLHNNGWILYKIRRFR